MLEAGRNYQFINMKGENCEGQSVARDDYVEAFDGPGHVMVYEIFHEWVRESDLRPIEGKA